VRALATEALQRARAGQKPGELQAGREVVDPAHYRRLLAEESIEKDRHIAELERKLAAAFVTIDRLEKRLSNAILQARGRPG
jgi:hypothetical protein